MIVSFGIVLLILGKFAWPAILNGLSEREQSIREALDSAKEAQEQMKRLKLDNDKMLREAMEERDVILTEARKIKDKIIGEAKEKAGAEALGIVESAKEKINNEKLAALREIKSTVAEYSIEIAEKILREELKDKAQQKKYIEKLLKETSLN